MALTWEFYVAMVLLFVAAVIVIVFVYLLLWPQSDLFDRLKRVFGKSKKGAPVMNGQGLPVAEKKGVMGKLKGMFKKKSAVPQANNGLVPNR